MVTKIKIGLSDRYQLKNSLLARGSFQALALIFIAFIPLHPWFALVVPVLVLLVATLIPLVAPPTTQWLSQRYRWVHRYYNIYLPLSVILVAGARVLSILSDHSLL